MAALLCTFFVVSHEELQLFHLPGSPYSRTDSEERLPSAEASPQLLQQLDIVILFYFIFWPEVFVQILVDVRKKIFSRRAV